MSNGHRSAARRTRNATAKTGEWTAVQRNARISPYKVRPSLPLIVGKPVAAALDNLRFEKRRGSALLVKVLQSAIANASYQGRVDPMDLKVLRAVVDGAFTIRRVWSRGRGRSTQIERRNCHITVVVAPKA